MRDLGCVQWPGDEVHGCTILCRAMAEQITIPITIFELSIRYEKPVMRLLADHAEVDQALLEAFAEFEPDADELELVATGKTTERGTRLRLTSQKITLFFGATNCKFTKEGGVWADADEVLRVLDLFLTILTNVGRVVPGKKVSILSLHLQPKTASFKDILRPFVDSNIQKLDAAPLEAMAIVARWPYHRITLDGSAQLANGIFLQMERDFEASVSLDDIKRRILDDEIILLKLLGVEEVEA